MKARVRKKQAPASRPRAVAARLPGLGVGRPLYPEGECWRLEVGTTEVTAVIDPAVDPVLVEEASRTGARVVLSLSTPAVILGLLVTARSLQLDRSGNLDATVPRFAVTAGEVLLKTQGAFLELKAAELELFGNRVVCRARELTRILGRMIKLN